MNNYYLRELISIKNGKEYTSLNNGNIPVYGTGGIMCYVDKALYSSESILLPRKGTLDNIMYVEEPFWTIDTMYWTIVDKSKVYPKYLYLYLSMLDLSCKDSGSTLPSMTFESYYSIQVKLPSMEKQVQIADCVFTILNKIKKNNEICLGLELLAKTIYDYWFLQFEFPNEEGKPYKSSGGKMVWNEELKREIPEGWEVCNLFYIADFINGLACQKHRPKVNEKSLPVVKIDEMHNGINNSTEEVSVNIPEKHIIDTGDILFAWSASLEVQLWKGTKAGLNQHIFKVKPKNYAYHYVYETLSSYVINFIKMAEARKTTMGHITQDHLMQSRITIPPVDITQRFEKITKPLYEKQILVSKQNEELKKLRDFLLPLLMNGQIGFKEG